MNYYVVIGILNTSMSALFSASLLVIWRNNRQLDYILTFGASYAIRFICFVLFYFAFSLEDAVLRFSANVLLFLSVSFLSIGLSHRRNRPPRLVILFVMAAATLSALYYYQFHEISLLHRVVIFNFGISAVSLFMIIDLNKTSARSPVENVFLGLAVVSSAGFLLRPLFLIASDITDERFESSYWLVVSISDALICAMTAVGIFALIANDMMESIKSEAHIDALSGLLNRRGFETRTRNILAQQTVTDRAAIILSDLDHFKAINDRFGHGGGDKIIRKFSDVLKAKASGDAIIARLGGEEFAVLLPPGGSATALPIAENVRSAFKEVVLDIVGGLASPTASFGIAFGRDNEDLNTLIERADSALYQAKSDGRNCVRIIE